jgi:hypothetical protein
MATMDELLQEAADWRQHLYRPGSMVHTIINATAEPARLVETFDPREVVDRYHAGRKNRVEEHIKTVASD